MPLCPETDQLGHAHTATLPNLARFRPN